MFAPPLKLMWQGPLESAQQKAEKEKKWLLINIQEVGNKQTQTQHKTTKQTILDENICM